MNWHLQSITTALGALKTQTETGLSQNEAESRLTQYGRNELVDKGGRTPLKIFWEQITATMVLILIAAAVIAGLLGDLKNSIAISAIVILFSILGFVQEYRAEQAIAALKKLSVPNVRVQRDGKVQQISARDLVPGDILQLEAGNVLPADVRLLEAVNLRVQEAALTGESEPVEKQTAALSGEELPLGDRRNMAYMGTIVTQGRGLALVVATGMQTELGKIANLIQQSGSDETPLQKRLDSLGKNLALVGVVIAVLIAVLGLLRGDELRHMLLTAVSVAVAIVPEGLPAVVTITLAFGAQRMLEKNALIRKLPAVETLGCVTVICSDKTGTLTENRMSVIVLDVANHALDLTEEMNRSGSFTATRHLGAPAQSALSLAAIGGTLCNDARLVDVGDDRFHTLGDPTEGALVTAAAKMGYWKSSLDSSFPRAAELPFDSDRKRMTTVHHLRQYDPEMLAGLDVSNHRYIAFTKGSVDGLIDLSSHVWVSGRAEKMDDSYEVRIEAANQTLAKKGMRVLGVAFRLINQIPEIIQTDLEQNVTFVGLFGMIDPPRNEVRDAVAVTKSAGIRTVMITGDHPLTATEIACQLGIIETDNIKVLTGAEIENLSFNELKNSVDDVQVFARVSPEHKLKIVQALQERGHIVSMTGDGVNDAPALKRADIGVAMGITGTDVSKEAADMVLTDDNFASIVAAVEEGRSIFANIQKFLRFLLSSNIGEVLTVFLGVALAGVIGLTAGGEGALVLPLLATQILWINLITDGAPALALGLDPADPEVMNWPPRPVGSGVITRRMWGGIAFVGIIMAAGTLLVLDFGLPGGLIEGSGDLPYARTMAFTTLVLFQLFNAPNARSDERSAFHRLFRNPWLLWALVLSLALQILVVYAPFLQPAFGTVALSLTDWLVCVAVASSVLWLRELSKLFVSER